MRDGIKAIVCLSLVILMGWYLWSLYNQPAPTVFHYQAKPEETIRSSFNDRIGKQNYTIELAWVARTQDGQVYIERIR
jgi:hypothetical protein